MRAARASLVTVVAALSLFTCAACSVERHHRLLSFFFDGVPDPEAPTHVEPALESAQGPAVAPAAPAPEDRSSIHPPVRERLCHQCHMIPERNPGAGWQAGLPELVVPREELCRRCHTPPVAAHVHGPAGAQRCDLCHEPHQSAFPHLLRVERQEALCRTCHQGELFTTSSAHEAYATGDCIECHDPHGSESPFLLRAGRDPVLGAREGAE